MTGTELIRYDAMCHAIAAAYEVDEVKDIRDKARAIEVYARQARNVEAERRACEIRLRAERKCGVLLRQMEKAKGAPGNQYTGPVARCDQSKTLDDLGISKTQSSRWQKMADIPDDEFEDVLAAADHPTTTGLITEPSGPTPVDDRALWLWGRLKDFVREGLLDEVPEDLITTMLPHMEATTRELAPQVAAWLERIKP